MWSAHHESFEEIFLLWKESILLIESATYAKKNHKIYEAAVKYDTLS